MSKLAISWHSDRLEREVNVVRWGEVGQPVLMFSTAAGDAEEIERFLMIDTLADFLEQERIKLYSVDSVPGIVWMTEDKSSSGGARVQNAFDAFLYHELVPAIRKDCDDDEIEIITAGASIGAFEAVSAVVKHPDVFKAAIALSGTYDLSKFLEGPEDRGYYEASPLLFIPDLDPESEQMKALRERFVLIAHGTGRWEEPAQSWRMAQALGAMGIPNRVDEWGEEWDHDWPTWRKMMPQFVDELVPAAE